MAGSEILELIEEMNDPNTGMISATQILSGMNDHPLLVPEVDVGCLLADEAASVYSLLYRCFQK